MTDIVVRYFFADKAKGPDMEATAAAAPAAEYVLAAIQDLMIASDPYLVGRFVSFSDLLAPIVAYFTQFQEGTSDPRAGQAAQALALVARDAAAAELCSDGAEDVAVR